MSKENAYKIVVKGIVEQTIPVEADSDEEAIAEAKEQFLEHVYGRLTEGSFNVEEAAVEPACKRQMEFQKSVREYCLARDKNKELAEKFLDQFMEDHPAFDPFEGFYFKELCAVEEMAGLRKVVFNRSPLTEKKAALIDYREVITPYSGKMSEVTEGYELWLLEDMTFLVTYFHQMRIGFETEFEIHRYREIADRDYYGEDYRFYTKYFLQDIQWKLDPEEDDEN